MRKKILLSVAFIAASFTSFAQVGVGTTDPKAALDIVSDKGILIPRIADHLSLVPVDGTLDANEAGLQVYNTTTKKVMLFDGTNWVEATGASGKFVDGTNIADAVFTGGFVGIGTTEPNSDLHIKSATASINIERLNQGGHYTARRFNGTIASPTQVLSGELVARYSGQSLDDVNVSFPVGWIDFNAGEDQTATAHGGYISFHTTALGTKIITEKMRISSDGNVGIGTTTPGAKLHVGGVAGTDGIMFPDGTLQTTASKGNLYKVGTNHITSDAGVGANGTNVGTGTYNIGIGFQALNANTSGSNNTAIGFRALWKNTTGYNNIASGYNSLNSNTSGFQNVSIGVSSLTANTIGTHNVSVGNNSLAANIGGAENTALGYTALNKNVSGIRNVSVGFSSLFNNLGSGNIGIGYASLYEGTTGVDNTIIGNNTGRGITTGTKNTILGANVIGLTATLSNNIIIADGDGNQRIRVLANGNVGIGVTAPTSKLQVTGLVEYASDAAAGTAGLTTGAFYHTAGTVKIKL